jgi:hypothetical protein
MKLTELLKWTTDNRTYKIAQRLHEPRAPKPPRQPRDRGNGRPRRPRDHSTER